MAWELINPAMQIMVYWFVFGLELELIIQSRVSHLFIGYSLVLVCGSL